MSYTRDEVEAMLVEAAEAGLAADTRCDSPEAIAARILAAQGPRIEPTHPEVLTADCARCDRPAEWTNDEGWPLCDLHAHKEAGYIGTARLIRPLRGRQP